MEKRKVYITDTNCITPLGLDVKSTMDQLIQGKSGIRSYENKTLNESFYVSKLDWNLINKSFERLPSNGVFTPLEKLMILTLKPLVDSYGIQSAKTGLIISTTKGNIDVLQSGQEQGVLLSDLSKKIAHYFGFEQEPIIVSNACVSGVLAVAVAKRMIQAGVYDNFYVLAGDLVSDFVVSGFNSFQALSDEPCKPYDETRKGVTLGEAGVAVYVTADATQLKKGSVAVIGDGAVNDANHISGPSRTGEGLYQSIESAFNEAQINKGELDYISAHGTATLYNDEMESIAFNRSGIHHAPLNSLKGYFGHTLGASGLLETVIAMASAQRGIVLGSKGFEKIGVTNEITVSAQHNEKKIRYFLKTASGFGGCNTAVLFETF